MDFLTNLYSDASGWLTLWTKQDKKTQWFKDRGQAQETALALSGEGLDVYFGVCLQKTKARSGRGSADNVSVMPGVWIDIDIAGKAHAQGQLPATMDEARQFLTDFPLEASYVINSGHGLHAYWIFREPWILETDAERAEAADLSERFQKTIRALGARRGWKIDSTHDLARILRLPGTVNYKTEPKEVKILDDTGCRYNQSEIEDHLLDDTQTAPAKKTAGGKPEQYGPARLILENCKYIQYCRDHAATITEPEWYGMISNIARAEGGPELCHELSQNHSNYSHRETEEKLHHAIARGAPHGCDYIRDTLAFTGCPAGGCPGVTAPVGFALSQVAKARDMVKGVCEKSAFQPETIGALAVLKKEDPGEYAQIKASLKGSVNLNDLERAVNKRIADNQKLRIVSADDAPVPITEILPDIPLKELKLPNDWTLTERGVWQNKRNKDGELVPICASPIPVILTKRMRNVDSSEEKVELSFYRDAKWQTISSDRATVFSRQGLVQLGNRGLVVSTETAKFLVQYLDSLERANLNHLPLVKSVGHFGWVDSKHFLPGVEGDFVLDVDEGTGAASIASGYRIQGDTDEWAESLSSIREFPIARFILAASFAAPLLRIIGQRVFIIHSWGPSRGGKTAVLKAALSVWGDPEDLIASFNATKVGLERLAAFYSDLPLGIDERQVVGDKQGFVESLVYLLGLGKGKARGSKGGGLQQFSHWRTIAITTGEEPLSTGSSSAGIRTRALEIYGEPIPSEDLASSIHDATSQHYGSAGPHFVENLIRMIQENPDVIRDDFVEIRDKFSQDHKENISTHISAISIVALADYYAGQWLFGQSEEDAAADAVAMARDILARLTTAAEADEGTRAYEYLLSWYGVHSSYFKAHAKETYGWEDLNKLFIYPTVFDAAMKEGGFNPDRILRDWAAREMIDVDTTVNKDKVRFKVRKWNSDKGRMEYFVALKLLTDSPVSSE